MSEFLKKRLAEAAAKQSEKRKQWQEIQARAPKFAADLQLLNAAFGKVKLLSVDFL